MKDSLRFVTFLAPNMKPVYQFIADYVAEKLGFPTTLTVGTSFDQFALGQADVGFICGLPYVNLMGQPTPSIELLAAPVLQGERYQGKPVYFSDVIVRRDSPFQTFADLRGSSWAFNDPDSHSGYGVVRYWLAMSGTPPGYFSRVVEAGFHQESIRKVCLGEVDASAIDSQVLAIELRNQPDLDAQIRIIDTLGPSPIQPVVAAAQLSSALKSDLRAVLLEIANDPSARSVLSHGLIERFAAVDDAAYDDIRQMIEIARDVQFP
jgi:phosphonate transport system substrate-binding protein